MIKTKDGHEIKAGDKLFDRWGNTVIVGGIDATLVWQHGGEHVHYPNRLFKSEKLALEYQANQLAKQAWEKEQDAKKLRDQETQYRSRIAEIEKLGRIKSNDFNRTTTD